MRPPALNMGFLRLQLRPSKCREVVPLDQGEAQVDSRARRTSGASPPNWCTRNSRSSSCNESPSWLVLSWAGGHSLSWSVCSSENRILVGRSSMIESWQIKLPQVAFRFLHFLFNAQGRIATFKRHPVEHLWYLNMDPLPSLWPWLSLNNCATEDSNPQSTAHPPIHLHYPYSFCTILPCFLDEWVQQFLKLLPESLISHGIEGAQVFFHSFRADVLVVHRGAQARQSFKDLNLGGARAGSGGTLVGWIWIGM